MSKENMTKIFKKFKANHNFWEIYSDFIEVGAIAISNAVDYKQEREDRYLKTINKYEKQEQMYFGELIAELTETLDKGFSDVLGELFMELDLGSKWNGQCFTPYSISRLTADMCFNDIKKKIDTNGYITLNEPSVGGGAMVIAIADIMKLQGYNPQQQLKVICNDLDIKCVYMTYLQLSLLGIPAKVYQMNSLSLEVFDCFKTPFWILGFWDLKKEKNTKIDVAQEDNGQLKLII